MARSRSGFTLVELLVTIAIIALLAGIAVPLFGRLTARAKSTKCMGNLRQIGIALNLYLGEHDLVMPTMAAGRGDAGSPERSLDTVLGPYVDGDEVFRCPADTEGLYYETGTSYIWNHLLNGQHVDRLEFFGRSGKSSGIPVVADKEGFHDGIGDEVNVLYADGHVDRKLNFNVQSGEESR